ncbi:hypothetical protein JF75_05500 [Lactobacillus kimbladii]|uniref:Uncharacterized protein n=1 Tax=Lactobacillus kimbladii TaxID=1218506 RepID=A0A0F4LKI3_9LACO|nr:hypothetical protein [Lactobacillus kimbladii]KJY59090.1 hypothetical protein JF75_05500 [Lactobacillus kimbladii]
MKSKIQIAIASLIAIAGLGATGYFKMQQIQIDQQVAAAKVTLAKKEKQVDNIATVEHKQKIKNDPVAKINEKQENEIKLMQNNGQALFKLLYTMKDGETQTDLDIRNKNLPRYATNEALTQTGLNSKSIKETKEFKNVVEHINMELSTSPADNHGIYSGVIAENSVQSSINFVGKRNKTDWYLFKYDSNTNKFIQFTLLGFNFTHAD